MAPFCFWIPGCLGRFSLAPGLFGPVFLLGLGFSARFCFAPGFFGLVFVSVPAAPVRASHSEAGLELEHGIGSGGWRNLWEGSRGTRGSPGNESGTLYVSRIGFCSGGGRNNAERGCERKYGFACYPWPLLLLGILAMPSAFREHC